MVKNIYLRFDEQMFYKFKEDKLRREEKLGNGMTWEVYFYILFGFSKLKNGGKNGNNRK